MPHILAFLAGFTVCLVISIVTGSNEAFDSPAYFRYGIPIMCVLAALLGYFFPVRAWRWAVSMGVGQFIAILLGGNSLSLWPLAIIAMAILSIPQLICALIAARFSRYRTQRSE